MTDQTESERAELLERADARLSGLKKLFDYEVLIRDLAAALRALKAKVREDAEMHERIEAANHREIDRLRADRDRLAGEVGRWQREYAVLVEGHVSVMDARDRLDLEVTRLTSELAAARENEARYAELKSNLRPRDCFDQFWLEEQGLDLNSSMDACLDAVIAARSAAGEEG